MNFRSIIVGILLCLVSATGYADGTIAPAFATFGNLPNVFSYNATGDGTTDDGAAFTQACGVAVANGNPPWYVSTPVNPNTLAGASYNVASLGTIGATVTASTAGNTFHVTAISSGSLGVGQFINSVVKLPVVLTGILPTAGGDVATYSFSGAAQTISSTTFTTVSSCGDVQFVGQGTLVNPPANRKFIFAPTLAQAPEPVLTWNGATQFPRLSSALSGGAGYTPVVDIVGDSTCGYLAPNANNQSEYLYEVLYKKIASDYGGNVIINNRCWAGTSWQTIASIGVQPVTNIPPWATNSSASWQSYVFADAPDAIVFDFGMNDGASADPGASYTAMLTFLAAEAAQPKPADTGFVINYVPSVVFSGTSQSAQEGREAIAGWQRSYAQRRGLGYIDLGRRFDIARDGFDPTDGPLSILATGTFTTTYTWPQVTRDFGGTFYSSGDVATFWGGSTTVTLATSNNSGSQVVVSNSGGFIAVTTTPATGVAAYPTIVSTVATTTVAAGDATNSVFLNFSLKGGHLVITYQNLYVVDVLIDRPGGLFTPTVTVANPGDSQNRQIQGPAVVTPRLYMPQMADYEIYGTGVNGNPWGGGGFNHMATRGVAEIVAKEVNAQQFYAPAPAPTAENRVINGSATVSQPNATGNVVNVGATNKLVLDRWHENYSIVGNTIFFNQSTTAPAGFSNSIFAGQTNSLSSPSANAFVYLTNSIDGPDIADLGWGAAGASPIVLSFWAQANNTGTYSCALSNGAKNRIYVQPFTVPTASTWKYYSFIVPGDTTGSWVTTSGATGGLLINCAQTIGSTYQTGTLQSWTGGFSLGPTGTVQMSNVSGATERITGMRVIKGSYDRSAIQRPFAQELSLAQRFYRKGFPLGTVPANNLGTNTGEYQFPATAIGTATSQATQILYGSPMAASPTITFFNPSAANANCRDETAAGDGGAAAANNNTTLGFTVSCTGNASTAIGNVFGVGWTADVGF